MPGMFPLEVAAVLHFCHYAALVYHQIHMRWLAAVTSAASVTKGDTNSEILVMESRNHLEYAKLKINSNQESFTRF